MRMGPLCAAPPLLVVPWIWKRSALRWKKLSARLVLPETMGGSFKEMLKICRNPVIAVSPKNPNSFRRRAVWHAIMVTNRCPARSRQRGRVKF
jgi:hypothetical protein